MTEVQRVVVATEKVHARAICRPRRSPRRHTLRRAACARRLRPSERNLTLPILALPASPVNLVVDWDGDRQAGGRGLVGSTDRAVGQQVNSSCPRSVRRVSASLRSLLHQHQLARCVAASPSCTFVSLFPHRLTRFLPVHPPAPCLRSPVQALAAATYRLPPRPLRTPRLSQILPQLAQRRVAKPLHPLPPSGHPRRRRRRRPRGARISRV